ncbi:hypothetical protein N9224_01320 [Akkermansiaceae bacterium]|nr:hypothetical protein [Akkermansiaceae bacterium]
MTIEPPNPQNTPEKDDPTQSEPLSKKAGVIEVFECLLKHPHSLINTIRQSENPSLLIGKLLILALGGFLIFGLTLGSFSFHEQLWLAPIKTILGLAITSIICLPSLYIFSALTGTTLGIKEIVQGMAGALALIAALLLGFTPVLWVFSQSTNSEPFFGFLVLIVWLIALFFGTGLLLKMLDHSGTKKKGPLRIWIGIFLLVSLQMSTTLRPIIGRSDAIFTSEKRFFMEHWAMEMTGNSDITEKPRRGTRNDRGVSEDNPYLDE